MKLQFLTDRPNEVDLRANEPTRPWMDDTTQSFAYRCLPLNIANAHGWSFHLTKSFAVIWTGGHGVNDIIIESDGDVSHICASAFGHGILTFHLPGIFKTEPGWNMLASGPLNSPRRYVQPLSGIIETDWGPYSFTMNWQITQSNVRIEFKEGEAFCSIFPVQRQALPQMEPEILPMSADPDIQEKHKKWSQDRNKFIDDLYDPDSDAAQQKWQKSYYQGKNPDGSDGVKDHIIKLRLKEFERKSGLSD